MTKPRMALPQRICAAHTTQFWRMKVSVTRLPLNANEDSYDLCPAQIGSPEALQQRRTSSLSFLKGCRMSDISQARFDHALLVW